jgi:alkyl hydroperoxide reductase subunit AhpF
MVTSAEASEIIRLDADLNAPLVIQLSVSGDQRSVELRRFTAELTRLASRLHIAETTRADRLPGIWIGERLGFHAIPTGRKLKPCLDLIRLSQGLAPACRDDIAARLATVVIPVSLRLYITSACPFCPRSVEKFGPLPLYGKSVRLAVIDGTLFPEMARKDDIRSAPTLLLDGVYRFDGGAKLGEVVDMIATRDPERLSSQTLQDMIGQGLAQEVAQLIVASQRLPAAFLELVISEKWPVRLGAMVVMEYLIDADAALAAQAADFLWRAYDRKPVEVRGDILYLLGELGDDAEVARIASAAVGGESDDLKAAAAEALEKLTGRK